MGNEMIQNKSSDKKIRGKRNHSKPVSEFSEFKDGLENIDKIEVVATENIDTEDRRFQYRVAEEASDLTENLRTEGQLVPIVLWGESSPFIIIDGFRRVKKIKALGWTQVKAIIHRSITEEEAYNIAFIENVKRKNLSPMDIANAIWMATKRGRSNPDLTDDFNLSERQLQRYRKIISFSTVIQAALLNGSITMAHGLILHQFATDDLDQWIDKIRNGLDAIKLKKQLKNASYPSRKPRKYFKPEKDGFRLYPINFSSKTDLKSREQILRCLKEAIKIIEFKTKAESNPLPMEKTAENKELFTNTPSCRDLFIDVEGE